MYAIAVLLLLLMMGSFGISNNDTTSATEQYENGIDMHAASIFPVDNHWNDILASGMISEVDKQTSANGICR
jgi:hypothetical protein